MPEERKTRIKVNNLILFISQFPFLNILYWEVKMLNNDMFIVNESSNTTGSNNYFDYYQVIKGDTLYKIANDNNINPNLLAELNGINTSDYIYPNQVLLIPKAGSKLYITAIGDTLAEVAKGLDTDIETLVNQNRKIYLQPEQLLVYKL